MNTHRWSVICFSFSLTLFVLSLLAFYLPAFPHPFLLLLVASGLLLLGALLSFSEARSHRPPSVR